MFSNLKQAPEHPFTASLENFERYLGCLNQFVPSERAGAVKYCQRFAEATGYGTPLNLVNWAVIDRKAEKTLNHMLSHLGDMACGYHVEE